MSKLTTALEGERERFLKSKLAEYINGVESLAFAHGMGDYKGDTIQDFLTASNIRILSIIEEWVKENNKKVTYEETTNISQALKNGSQNYGYNLALSDLTSFIQEAISNTTK